MSLSGPGNPDLPVVAPEHSTAGGAVRKIAAMLLPNRHGLWFRLSLMVGAVGLFLAGYQWGNRYQHRLDPLPAIGGVLLRPPGAIPAFRLQDPLGRVLDQQTLAAGWTLLTFGDLTAAEGQLAIQRLIDVFNRVADQTDLHRALRLVLVSGATVPALAQDYARLLPALFVLTGEAEEIGRLRAALGARGDDTAPLYVIAPGGFLLALFTDTGDGAQTAADLKALHDHLDQLLPEGQ